MNAVTTWLYDHVFIHVLVYIFMNKQGRRKFYERRQFVRDHGAELGEAYAAEFFDKYN
jgi:hypothetical protein